MFKSVASLSKEERDSRKNLSERLLSFGVKFLNDAFRGILPDDMVLLGASSGIGKTQLTTIIAQANLNRGKKVHLFALESSRHEIVQRLKFPYVAAMFFADPNRPPIKNFNMTDWVLGHYSSLLDEYEDLAEAQIEKEYTGLVLYTKGDTFGITEMIHAITACKDETDLIIIDHAHYFDYDGDNENKALKEIAKTVRTLSIDMLKPIVLVAHLRKRDRHNDDLAPGMEEFHGSSDLFKIATKVITIAPGAPSDTGKYETFIRIPKNRIDGTVTRYLGRTFFDPKTGTYAPEYKIGWAESKKTKGFQELAGDFIPRWATVESGGNGGGHSPVPPTPRKLINHAPKRWPASALPVPDDIERD